MSSKEYEQYERECEQIREENDVLLDDFARSLAQKGLSEQTIRKHVENIDLYINTYLLYEDAVPAREGAHAVAMFLGYWFIRKGGWSSPAAIRQNAASLKKFYGFLRARGEIEDDDLQDLAQTIKDRMGAWLATAERYDDPDITDSEDIWGA